MRKLILIILLLNFYLYFQTQGQIVLKDVDLSPIGEFDNYIYKGDAHSHYILSEKHTHDGIGNSTIITFCGFDSTFKLKFKKEIKFKLMVQMECLEIYKDRIFFSLESNDESYLYCMNNNGSIYWNMSFKEEMNLPESIKIIDGFLYFNTFWRISNTMSYLKVNKLDLDGNIIYSKHFNPVKDYQSLGSIMAIRNICNFNKDTLLLSILYNEFDCHLKDFPILMCEDGSFAKPKYSSGLLKMNKHDGVLTSVETDTNFVLNYFLSYNKIVRSTQILSERNYHLFKKSLFIEIDSFNSRNIIYEDSTFVNSSFNHVMGYKDNLVLIVHPILHISNEYDKGINVIIIDESGEKIKDYKYFSDYIVTCNIGIEGNIVHILCKLEKIGLKPLYKLITLNI